MSQLVLRFCAALVLFAFVAGQTVAQQHEHAHDHDEEHTGCLVCATGDTAPTITTPGPKPRAITFVAPYSPGAMPAPAAAPRVLYLSRGPPLLTVS